MALDVINNEGGIKGRHLKLVYADEGTDLPAQSYQHWLAESAIKGLVKKHEAVMLVGGYASSATIHTARLAEKFNVPFLITTAADDRITQKKWKNIYRMNPPIQEYARGVEELLLNSIKPASMAIVYENSPYGTGGALRMMWFCRENNIAIHKIIPYHKERASPSYFQKLLGPLQDNPPATIYMVSYLKDAVFLVKKIRELNINALMIAGAGGFTHQKFITMAGDAADGLLTASLWSPQLPYPGAADYYNRYHQNYSIPPDYHGAEAYASLFVIADALNRSESLRPESIRIALNETDIVTSFGPVKFQSYGKFERQNSVPTMVLRVTKGKFEVVWPENLASVRSPGSSEKKVLKKSFPDSADKVH